MIALSITTDTPTRSEIEEAIREHVATLKRMPAHWADRRASIHDKINTLLTQREETP